MGYGREPTSAASQEGIVIRSRLSYRLGAALAIAALLLSTFGLGASLAANTRMVSFGSPGQGGGGIDAGTGALVPGVLEFSPVTAGSEPGRTAVDVIITNVGGQTLNHVKFAGGTVADGLPYNPNFVVEGTTAPKPPGPSFPADVELNQVFPQAGCDLTIVTGEGEDGLLCDVGTLAAGASAPYTIVFTPPHAAPASRHIWLTVSWNEGWSATGNNADYAFAEGDIAVTKASCTNPASGYFLENDNIDLAANGGGTCQGQQASIASGDPLEGIRGRASVLILNDGTEFLADCPSELKNKCFGVTVQAFVLEGAPVDGGVEWTVRWYGIKSLSGVVHFGDNYGPAPDMDPTDYSLIQFSKSNKCVTDTEPDLDCWITKSSSPGGEKPVWFQATFVTPDNGRTGGYF